MKHSKTKQTIKRALVIISNNFGVNKKFYYTDLKQIFMAADIHISVIYFLKLSKVLVSENRGEYILKEYNANTHEKVHKVLQKYHRDRDSKRVRKTPNTNAVNRTPKKVKITRQITDKYILEQYEKRGLGKENKTTFWGALVSLFSK